MCTHQDCFLSISRRSASLEKYSEEDVIGKGQCQIRVFHEPIKVSRSVLVFQTTRGGSEWLLSDDKGNVRALLTINHAAPDGTPKQVFLMRPVSRKPLQPTMCPRQGRRRLGPVRDRADPVKGSHSHKAESASTNS